MILTQTRIAATDAHARFGRYKPEEKQSVRKLQVEGNEAREQMKTAWKSYRYSSLEDKLNYSEALNAVKNLKYSVQDVDNFSIALAEFQDEKEFRAKAGLFLSALINNGLDGEYVIHVAHLSVMLSCLCSENEKNVTIHGNIGPWLGCGTKSGLITVNGSVGDFIGIHMQGGQIIINGNAEAIIGGGLGYYMFRGEIHINGNLKLGIWKGNITGGKIYHNGILIGGKEDADS